MTVVIAIGHAFGLAFAMLWVILWPLILGFALSGTIQAVVSKQQMARVLGDDRPTTDTATTKRAASAFESGDARRCRTRRA